ncbi:hypothetical protein JOQ06_029072 [Pogonophryne albipinna]|uniref:Uncharacterized protein n=1 Tax=Pogonophryne albipinna TaxID=1090488 RepID=A0AAD6FN34_9TELE|nr:hypothetical protein JOQ06_029072 [Pogonophryne albipinna]
MADRMRQRALLTTSEALALLFDSSGSGNELDTNLEKDSEKDLDDSRCEKEGNDIDTGQRIEEETAEEASRADSDPDSWSESEHDDSVLDEDYRPKKDDRPDDDSDADTAQHSEEEAALETPAVKRHKRPRSHMWKRQVIKEKRLKGESYKNATGQERQPKTMGPPCTSQHCLRSEKRSCELLSEEERTDIFNNFWSMPSWETRKLYIQTLVENVPIKQKKGGVVSRRKTSLSYHLQLADRCKLPVCKIIFYSTLGIAPRTIGSWLTVDMKTKTDPPKPKINKTGPHMPISDADQTFLKEWLSGLPTVAFHYCRQVPSYQDKKFVEPGTVLSDLHKEYQKAAGKSGARVVSETYFRKVFSEQKYSVFVPKKDQCDVCIGAKCKHFESVLDTNQNIEKVIVWSDGCGYQNRCCTITNAYLDLTMKHGVTIEQKFLVAGHTQMECNSMHSLIERRTIKDIHTPRDYIVIFETARLHPSPYKVTQLYHSDFMKLSGAYVTKIRPGRKVGDPTVHDLRALQYLADGRIRHKLDFESDWEDLPQRLSIPEEPVHWVPLFPAQLPITLRKYNDLQAMKPVLPRVAHQYYDNLPHQ